MLTVVIPYIDTDAHLAERAIRSVEAQTLTSTAIAVHDKDRRGPQWARNHGLWQADTPFVTFLDADDWIEPTFAEEMIAAYLPNHYVYCDYWYGKTLRKLKTPARCYDRGVVTRLIRTETAREIGGFDETLKRLEDTEFWLRARYHGLCALHVDKPLLTYSADGARSTRHKDRDKLMQELIQMRAKYLMGCCGGSARVNYAIVGEKQEGDVLATPTWFGNRSFTGTVSGRVYPRASRGRGVWVDPRDLQAMNTLTELPKQKNIEETPVEEPEPVEHLAPLNGVELEALPDEDEINAMYRNELDELAQRIGVSTDGNKPDVLQRILNAMQSARG
jgi:hypothetical protein